MKEIVKFFWTRYRRATTMDAINKELGNHCKYWIEASEWVDSYKATLSSSKKKDFEKEWDKLEKEMTAFQDFVPTKKKKTPPVNPLGV